MRSEAEVTQMCTPGDDNLLIIGTSLGSLNLYDLNEFDSSQLRSDELDYDALVKSFHPDLHEDAYSERLQLYRTRYTVQWPTFATDGLPAYTHYSPIRKLVFITKYGGAGNAQIGVLDELLSVSTWSLIQNGDDFDLSMRIGGRYKMIENFNENLMYLPQLAQHITTNGIS